MFITDLDGLMISVDKETTVDENDIAHEEMVATVTMHPHVKQVRLKKEESFQTFWNNIEKAVLDVTIIRQKSLPEGLNRPQPR